MKKILLLLILFSVGLLAQSNLTKMLDKKLIRGSAVDLDGSTEYMSKSSPSKLDLNGTERITTQTNRDFETSVGDWTGAGNHSIAQSSTDKKTGTYSAKITSSAAGDATTNYVTLASDKFTALGTDANSIYEKYTFEFWARGTGILGSELVDAWTNSGTDPYETLTTSGSSITSAVNSSGNGACGKLITPTVTGETYKVTFTLTLNSGSLPFLYINGTAISNAGANNGQYIGQAVNGANTFYVTITTGYSDKYFIIKNESATDFAISDFSLKKITKPSITAYIGNQTKTVTNISCVPGTFTKFVWNFQATANEVNQPIKIYANQADDIYIDDVSLTKSFDRLFLIWFLPTQNANKYLIARDESGGKRDFELYTLTSNRLYFTQRDAGANPSSNVTTYTSSYSLTSYNLGAVIQNRTNNQEISLNGGASVTGSMANNGKAGSGSVLVIGVDESSTYDYQGLIGEIQIVRFTDISQSNVSATTLAQAYRLGIPKSWTGGSPEVVAHYKFRGSSDAQMLQDYSGNGNNLTGTNVTTADQTKGSYPTR